MTSSEVRVWLYLRRRQLDGWKFRRQAPIGDYIVDVYCPAARLVVELDGSSHDEHQFDHDQRRQAWLESKGYKVLRLSAEYPDQDPIEGVWEEIDLALSQAHVLPTHGEVARCTGLIGQSSPLVGRWRAKRAGGDVQ
jgi:very-short-patch-repair endonuclease